MPDGRVMLFLGQARSLIVLAANASSATFARSGGIHGPAGRDSGVRGHRGARAVDVQVQVAPGLPLSMTKHGSLRGTLDAPVSSQRRC
jgi:hypothetical protein